MSKEKEKIALESLKQVYASNREEKRKKYKKNFFGYLKISRKSKGWKERKEVNYRYRVD